jgi:hypothetical protein
VFTDCKADEGVDEVADAIMEEVLFA